ncbi:MAG: DUF202 domain-containing protein [Rubricoccaceae bacterium]
MPNEPEAVVVRRAASSRQAALARRAAPPYADLDRSKLLLTDRLAADRTQLANERTLLSYARTAMGLAAGGVSLLHFLDGSWTEPVGLLLLLLAFPVLGVGVWRYVRVRHTLHGLCSTDRVPPPPPEP